MIPKILFLFIITEVASFCSTDSDSTSSYHLGRTYSLSSSDDGAKISRHWSDSSDESPGRSRLPLPFSDSSEEDDRDTYISSDSDVSPRERRRQLAEINAMFPIDDYHPTALVQSGLPYTNIPTRKPLCIMPTIQEETSISSVSREPGVESPRKRWWMCFSC